MPIIQFADSKLECQTGDNLRQVLIGAGLPLYHPVARAIHCRGLGTCGTCAVQIEGEVSPMTPIERWRLSFPPHSGGADLRLACQCEVQGDLVVTRHSGLWGHKR